ncbi:MAG: redoxin domain-containing protein [Phycisphaerales bacterium]|nr:redoxin domain-containing protein [Phycisphaerales bacterium]
MQITTLLSLLISFNALADDVPVLKATADAPALTIETWVKGEEVKTFDPEKVYVIEFWATWCVPCLKSLPELTKMQLENPTDLVVIGVAASEKPDPKSIDAPPADGTTAAPGADPADPKVIEGKMLAKVQEFVTKQGDKMNYRVAFDMDGSMTREWMLAAKQRSMPCVFIIGKGGKIAWIGPAQKMAAPLAKALGKEIAPPKKKSSRPPTGGVKNGTASGEKPAPPKQPEE